MSWREDVHETGWLSGSEDCEKNESYVRGCMWIVECMPWEGGWVRMIEVDEGRGKHAYSIVILVVLSHRWDVPDWRCGEPICDVQQRFIVSDASHSVCEVHGDG